MEKPNQSTPETNEAQFGTGRVSVDFARRLERERDEARNAIRIAVAKFEKVKWGRDGHCGSQEIINELEDVLPENKYD